MAFAIKVNKLCQNFNFLVFMNTANVKPSQNVLVLNAKPQLCGVSLFAGCMAGNLQVPKVRRAGRSALKLEQFTEKIRERSDSKSKTQRRSYACLRILVLGMVF